MYQFNKISESLETRKRCLGNWCTLEDPDCERCGIDEALDELEQRLGSKVFQVGLNDSVTISPRGKPRKNKTDPYLDGRDRMNEFLKKRGNELRLDIKQQAVTLRDAFWKAYVEEQKKLDAMIK